MALDRRRLPVMDMRNPVSRYAVGTLGYTLAVILLGAYVRASGSGAGCGRSWPTCQGEFLPTSAEGAQAVEFAHRATSGLTGVLIIVLVLMVVRRFSAGHPARKAAVWSLVFVITEGLFGAALVRGELVADDASVARAIIVPVHLVNTLFLVAALVFTIWFASVGGVPGAAANRRLFRLVLAAAAAMILLAATGAIAALADTLFPSASVSTGLADDFDSASTFLTRLRIVHPVLAVAVGVFVAWIAYRSTAPGRPRSTSASALLALVGLQLAAGVVNVVLLTPIWLQLVHLLLADLLWIALIWFGLDALATTADERDSHGQAVRG